MQILKQLWLSVRNNPVFVLIWTSFTGALASQFINAYEAGSFSWTVDAWKRMATMAATTAIIALAHLYIPAPGSNPNANK